MTGLCGCLTSFSTFLRDTFLAITNDLPSAYHQCADFSLYMMPSAANRAPNACYSAMAVIAIIVLEVGILLWHYSPVLMPPCLP